jgi:predicted PurR-regulated permease PerM
MQNQTENSTNPAPQRAAATPGPANGSPGGLRQNANRLAIVGLLLLVTLAILPIARIFIVPVIVAAAFATLFFPLYRLVFAAMGRKRGLSSFICCMLLFLCLVTPTYIMVQLVVRQAIELYQTAEPMVKDIVTKGSNSEFLSRIQNFPLIRKLQQSNIDIAVPLQEGIKTLRPSTKPRPACLNSCSPFS